MDPNDILCWTAEPILNDLDFSILLSDNPIITETCFEYDVKALKPIEENGNSFDKFGEDLTDLSIQPFLTIDHNNLISQIVEESTDSTLLEFPDLSALQHNNSSDNLPNVGSAVDNAIAVVFCETTPMTCDLATPDSVTKPMTCDLATPVCVTKPLTCETKLAKRKSRRRKALKKKLYEVSEPFSDDELEKRRKNAVKAHANRGKRSNKYEELKHKNDSLMKKLVEQDKLIVEQRTLISTLEFAKQMDCVRIRKVQEELAEILKY